MSFLENKIWTFFKGMDEKRLCARLCPNCYKLFWGTDATEKELCNFCLNEPVVNKGELDEGM